MHVFGVRREWGGLFSEQCARVSGDTAFQFVLRFRGSRECMAVFINSLSLKGKPDQSWTALMDENPAWNFPPSYGEHSVTLIHEVIPSGPFSYALGMMGLEPAVLFHFNFLCLCVLIFVCMHA